MGLAFEVQGLGFRQLEDIVVEGLGFGVGLRPGLGLRLGFSAGFGVWAQGSGFRCHPSVDHFLSIVIQLDMMWMVALLMIMGVVSWLFVCHTLNPKP